MPTEFQKNIDTDVNNNPISIRDWASNTLSGAELEEYLEDETRNNTLMERYARAGLISQVPIQETVFVQAVGQNITLTVGQKTILAPGVTVLDIPIDPEFGAWHARYTSDPDINYNPTVQL